MPIIPLPSLSDPRYIPPALRNYECVGTSAEEDVQKVMDEAEAKFPNRNLLVAPFIQPGIRWAVYVQKED